MNGLAAKLALGTIAGLLYGLSATLMKPVVENLHARGLGGVVGAVVISSAREKERKVALRALEPATAPAQPSTG
jgi:hypothetical protein